MKTGTADAVLLPATELAHLAPDDVVVRIVKLEKRLRRAYAPNTLRALRSNFEIWRAWCGRRRCPLLPDDVDTLEAFLNDAIAGELPGDDAWSRQHKGAKRERKRATIEQYVASLTLLYRLAGQPNPLASVDGKLMWQGIRRHLAKWQKQAAPLGRTSVRAMTGRMTGETPRDLRDAALISVASETLMRCSELVAMNVEQVQAQPDGTARVFLPRSKTDQEGKGQLRMMSAETLQRVRHWCEAAKITKGALWRSTYRGNGRFVARLGAGEVGRIFKRRGLAAGVENASRWSGHSARVGSAQDLAAAPEASTVGIMQAGGWKTATMVARYTEAIEVGRGAMAKLLESEKTPR